MVKKYYIGSLLVQRYGHLTIPRWYYSDIIFEPSANQILLTVSIPDGYLGYIYGFFISASETNDFTINWIDINDVSRSYRIVLAGKGSIQYADIVPLNEGIPSKAGNIDFKIVNAGSTGSYYQVGLLVGDVYG